MLIEAEYPSIPKRSSSGFCIIDLMRTLRAKLPADDRLSRFKSSLCRTGAPQYTFSQISATKESGVPWWRIGLEALFVIGLAIGGGKYAGAVKAVKTLVNAIENNDSSGSIKEEVSDAANSLIEKIVKKVDPK